MVQYIDKDALVAKIEKIRAKWFGINNDFSDGQKVALTKVLSLIDTLEVKEVDLEKHLKEDIEDVFFNLNGVAVKGATHYLTVEDVKDIAKHFFGLGLKAKDWEKERMEECPYRQVGCTMYEGKILECRGACSWVVDYPKLKELKAQKGEEV